MRNSLLQEQSVAQAVDLARNASVALVGIGSHGSSSSEMVLNEFNLSPSEREDIATNYAGDIAARFYNSAGKMLSSLLDNRVIGLSLDEIRKIPRVIGVANGAEKVMGVIGAARSKLVDVLIIDLACANSILKVLSAAEMRSA